MTRVQSHFPWSKSDSIPTALHSTSRLAQIMSSTSASSVSLLVKVGDRYADMGWIEVVKCNCQQIFWVEK